MAKPGGNKRFRIGFVVLIAVGGMMAIFWPRPGSSIGHPVTYSDGTTLTLKEVTYGTEHRTRYFEFLASPQLISTNATSPP